MRTLAVAILLILLAPLCRGADKTSATPEDHCNDRPNQESDLVKTQQDAIRIAFAEWRAIVPDLRVDESVWQSGFTATLHECVWEVAEKPEPPRNYSTFVVRIGTQDGRYLGALITD
jgi:hypothetical protein